MSFDCDRSVWGGPAWGGLAALVIASAALSAGAAGCSGSAPPPPPQQSTSTTTQIVTTTSSPAATTSPNSDNGDPAPPADPSASATADAPSPGLAGSKDPAQINCATFAGLDTSAQRDILSSIAKHNPNTALDHNQDAYLNAVATTCSIPKYANTKVLDVLAIDGTKYQAGAA